MAGILFAYVVYPVGAMLGQSLTLPVSEYRADEMGWNPDRQPYGAPLRRLAAENNALEALRRTAVLALATVLLGSAWGGGLALLWWRREFPGRRIFAALGFAPILLPPLVGTIAFFRLIGEGGALWRLLGSDGRPLLSGFGQVLIVHTYSFGIYAYAYVSAALEDLDVSQEEAARSLGASGLRVFLTSVWPTIRAPLLASAFITFMAAAASFTAPYLLDNSQRYLTVEILNNEGDPGMQRALSVVLAALALLALPAFLYINARGKFGDDVALSVKGAARRELPPVHGARAALHVAVSCVAAVILLAPPVTVVISAFGAPTTPQNSYTSLLGAVASLNFDDWSSMGRSALYALAAAALDIAVALGIALALRRSRVLPATLVEFAVMLALALPGSALAIALLSVFNGRSLLAFGVPLGGTGAILILAYFIRDLPLAVRPVRAALSALGANLEHAAAGLGAAPISVLWRVTLPLMLPSVIAAALICFITGLGEYVASKLLYGPLTQPVSQRIEELSRSSPASGYALALWLMLGSAAVIGISRVVRRR